MASDSVLRVFLHSMPHYGHCVSICIKTDDGARSGASLSLYTDFVSDSQEVMTVLKTFLHLRPNLDLLQMYLVLLMFFLNLGFAST